MQLFLFNDCLRNQRAEHAWIGAIDVDEFIVLNPAAKTRYLPDFLQRYERYAAVAIQWRLFGPSGLLYTPRGGVLRSYKRCMMDPDGHVDGWTVKTLANTAYTRVWLNPHFIYPPDIEEAYEVRGVGRQRPTLGTW